MTIRLLHVILEMMLINFNNTFIILPGSTLPYDDAKDVRCVFQLISGGDAHSNFPESV